MKQLLILLLSFLLVTKIEAQILKKIANRIKDDAAWRVSNKVDNEVRKGVDSLFEAPKKIKNKKKDNQNNNETTITQNPANNNNSTNNTNGTDKINAEVQDGNGVIQKDGFITLELSANTVFAGGMLSITGESIKHENFNQVEITVSGLGTTDTKSISLNADGKFTTGWYAPDKAGNYTVTAKSSDKKSTQSEKFTVFELPKLNNWCDENINLTNKAYDNLKEQVEQVKSGISTKDKDELDKKLAELKDKVDAVIKLLTDLNTAGKETAHLAKSGKNLPPNFSNNLSQLNDKLAEQGKKMQQLEEYNNHKSSDNTICEYLVLVNEACAAFSVYTNIECFAIKGIIKNIVLDKGVPTYTGTINERANGLAQPNDFALKEPAKIFATALTDAESLTTKLGTASFAGDIAQFATDVLIKKYCGVFKGSLMHDYNIKFRNSEGQNWWTYGVEVKAVLSLRYPKEKGNGKIIKMKGNLEGNGTKFTFFQDIEKVEDLRKLNKSMYKMQVVPIRTLTPLAVSVATSERDIMGFGAIARGIATPAYFNFLVDAEYDVDAGKIKLFITKPIIDFSPAVANQFIFLMIGPDGLPYIRHMIFPIHKVNLTLGSLIKSNHEFTVDKDSKFNLSFRGKGNRHMGDKSTERETDLNFTLTAKKE